MAWRTCIGGKAYDDHMSQPRCQGWDLRRAAGIVTAWLDDGTTEAIDFSEANVLDWKRLQEMGR